MKKNFALLVLLTVFIVLSANGQIPTNGLVGYWPFNGNANDASGNGNNGTVNGAVLTADRFGNANSAYYFDGVNDYISIPNSPTLNFEANSQSYSISLWCKTNDPTLTSVSSRLIEKRNKNYPYSWQVNHDTVIGCVYDVSIVNIVKLSVIGDNIWHNLMVVVNQNTDSIYSYFDGQLFDKIKNTIVNTTINTAALYIAQSYSLDRPYHGIIDDIMIYNRVLTKSEVQTIYQSLCSVINISNGLAARYDFNGNAKDSSANGNNGTIYGAALTTDRFGNSNKAYSFNGVSNYIQVPDHNSLDITTNLTISAWIYPTAINGDRKIVTKFPADAYQLTIIDGKLSLLYKNGSVWKECKSNNTLAVNEWYMVTGVYDYNKSVMNIYVNAHLDNSTYASGSIPATTAPVVIGNNYGGAQYFQGKIDDVRIYNRALSICDIDSLYQYPKPRPSAIADFTINDTNQCISGNSFIFKNFSSGTVTSLWNFGDLTTSTQFSPSHTFSNAGNYNVKLVVTSAYGKDSMIKTVHVNPSPVSSFTTSDTSECLSGNNFMFTNNSSGASSYFWNFGDATTSTSAFPSHGYTNTGAFPVKLVSTTNFGCKDSIIKTLYVRPHPVSSFTINNNGQCLSGNNFAFTNTATGASTYLWHFGDAVTSVTASPFHSYTTAGGFTVKLVSITTYGCKDSSSKTLDVWPQPVSAFTINNNSQCLTGNNFIFTNTTTGASSYLWNFGDASATTTTSPSYSYTAEGSFIVKLVSTSTYGCKDSATKTLNVRSMPVSSFTVNNNSQCLKGNNFAFTNTSTGASTYIWDFDDSITSIAASPSHTYTTTGTFNVKLFSLTIYGCEDSTASTVFVKSAVVNLGKDTTIYGTDSLILNPGSGFDSYLWLDYYTTSTLIVSSTKNGFGAKTFWVKVTKDGCEGYDTITVTLKLKNSIIEQNAGFNVKIYPNPVSNTLNIELNSVRNGMVISLTDVCGKQLKFMRIMPEHLSSIHQLDVSGLVKGIYYLNISNSEGRKVTKILKL
jgi:PKD repeat protein